MELIRGAEIRVTKLSYTMMKTLKMKQYGNKVLWMDGLHSYGGKNGHGRVGSRKIRNHWFRF